MYDNQKFVGAKPILSTSGVSNYLKISLQTDSFIDNIQKRQQKIYLLGIFNLALNYLIINNAHPVKTANKLPARTRY